MQFEIDKTFTPKGDQQQAIDKLAKGLDKPKRQTLLGVTGSGKSLDYDEQIIIRNSSGKIIKTKIGKFVEESIISRSYKLDDSIIAKSSGNKIISFGKSSFKISESEIVEVSKHNEKHIFEITLDDYSKIRVTKDHNCFRLKNANLELCATSELKIGDYLPSSNNIPSPQETFNEINLFDYNQKVKVSIGALLEKLQKNNWLEVLKVKNHSPAWKLRQIKNKTKERSISQEQLSQILKISGKSIQEVNSYIKLSNNHGQDLLSPLISITDDFLVFMGLYIAEGHSTKKYLLISNTDRNLKATCKRFWSKLGLKYNERNNCDIQYNSVLMNRFFKEFGSTAYFKKVPSFLYNLSNKQLSIFLRSVFDGDGWVEDNSVLYSSASKELIYDLKNLLLRFNITSRINLKKNKKYNRNYYKLSISGNGNITHFREKINFSINHKIKKLERIRKKTDNTNVDLFPQSGEFIKKIRTDYFLSQRDLGKVIGCNRSYISMIESGVRSISKKKFLNLANWLTNKEKRFEYLKNLLEFNYRRIKSIKKVNSTTGFVYDLSIKDNENFMAGYGSIFVHNTFTIANVIAQAKKPTLVLAHNKTLAAQLYAEFSAFFPKNAVRYFVSYYDYYQPESYLPGKDVYIEKDSAINERIDQLRIAATAALISRSDVIVVASVSCIYGLGDPKNWYDLTVRLKKGQGISRKKILEDLINVQYERNNTDLSPGHVRVNGDTLDIRDGPTEEFIRVQLFGDEIEKLSRHNYITGNLLEEMDEATIFPAKHYIIKDEQKERAIKAIREELEGRLPELAELERQRLKSRVQYDLEMVEELGYCKGIENYSRHFDGRKAGEPPYTLLDFFPKDFLLVVDESHVTLPQVHGMQAGDESRKKNLIDYGFRLPSAYDNRPLKYEEFDKKLGHVIYVSATPGDYELKESKQVVEQLVRPTGLLDPLVEVRGTKNQIDDLYNEIVKTEKQGFRTLVTTLTKKMAEDLSEYLAKKGLKVRYLHSEIDTMERTEIIRQLRLKTFDCLVGINLMREGIDIPEVALVAILDADKEGFLRNARSLIQTMGRAARNSEGRVILYADRISGAMKTAMDETDRRRKIQMEYNKKHNITPKTIIKSIKEGLSLIKDTKSIPKSNIPELLIELTQKMELAAEELKFEDAIILRNQIIELEKRLKDKN